MIATFDKQLFYYEAVLSYGNKGQTNFKQEASRVPGADPNKGTTIFHKPKTLLWDDDKVYLSSKHGYVIMDKVSGTTLAKYDLEVNRRSDPQMITVCRGRCLVVTNNN